MSLDLNGNCWDLSARPCEPIRFKHEIGNPFGTRCSDCSRSCDQPKLYNCKTCSCRFCLFCASNHGQRKHLITDHQGKHVSVCGEHGIIKQQFCKTCSLSFCFECAHKHTDHMLGNSHEKARELKRKLHTMLNRAEDVSNELKSSLSFMEDNLVTSSCEYDAVRKDGSSTKFKDRVKSII